MRAMRVLLATISLAAALHLGGPPRQRQPRRVVTRQAASHGSDAPPECQPQRPRRDDAPAVLDRRKALAATACILATPAYAETEAQEIVNEVIQELLGAIEENGGEPALKCIKAKVPTYQSVFSF